MIGGHEKYKSWIPHGFRFYSPGEAEKFLRLQESFRSLFRESGCSEIIPPVFDYLPTFELTSTGENLRFFETRDADGERLSARADLTVQVIKAAANGNLEGMSRLFYIQNVFKDSSWGAGNLREVMQAGVELLGNQTGRFEEILSLARRSLEITGNTGSILYGDARFLDRLFSMVPDAIRSGIAESFHIKDTASIAAVCRDAKIEKATASLLTEVPLIFGGTEALETLSRLCSPFPSLMEIIAEAEKIKDVVYDFSLVRELSYYTGPVIEVYIAGSRERILTGGVYDNLFEKFSNKKSPACGFAVNLTVLSEMQKG